ncbi:hypothetical protein [Rubripirellula tenax]|nr:hypothetical protein [Rubripirellula tenax]
MQRVLSAAMSVERVTQAAEGKLHLTAPVSGNSKAEKSDLSGDGELDF